MRQGNILNEATAVSPATFLGEAIRILILIVAPQSSLTHDRGGRERAVKVRVRARHLKSVRVGAKSAAVAPNT
jgi:hypothetical protein